MSLLITLIIVFIFLLVIYRLPQGCNGNCQQGRKECDCKGKL